MEESSSKSCPICRTPNSETIQTLACGNLDNSRLYPTLRINICHQCGHAFNVLSHQELDGLNHYYSFEYAPANLHAPDKKADVPGSDSQLTANRYSQLYQALSPHLREQHEILDVGCALGGFLDYLKHRGFTRLSGVDMAEAYVEQAREKNRYRVELGNAESLPFRDQEFDALVMEQVLEHLADPIRAFQEAKRVLKSGGIFCIGVPDASRYADFYFFDFYWLLLREHIQHFDVDHLNLLARNAGFEMLAHYQTTHAVMSERMIMPNLYAVFRSHGFAGEMKEGRFNGSKLKQRMAAYLDQEKSRQLMKSRRIAELSKSGRPVYAWGIGREFLYLYESAGLKNCRLAGLIDGNKYKQKACSVDGRKIADPGDLLGRAAADSVLVITAIAHTDPIKTAARTMGFRGEIIDWDTNGNHS
jgi:ubiquinone/menaquinone biosynthesis C-methylase UbiE